jgi:hypothetical protein
MVIFFILKMFSTNARNVVDLVLLFGDVNVVELLVRDVGLLEDHGQVEQGTDQTRR